MTATTVSAHPRMRPLGELLTGTTVLRGASGAESLSVPVYVWQLADGRFFFKLRSPRFRGSAAEAIRRGAQYVILEDGDDEERTLPPGVPYLIVDDVNQAFARACSRMFGEAHRQLTLIGVAGGQGRTTVSHLVEGVLRSRGVRGGLLTPLAFHLPESEQPAPGPISSTLLLHSFFAGVCREGGTHAVIEIGPADLADERFFGLQFDALVFTGGDRHDVEAVRRLFVEREFHKSPATLCAFNGDDASGAELASSSAGEVVTFGFGTNAGVTPPSWSSDAEGVTLQLDGGTVRAPLAGTRHAANLLAAATVVNRLLPAGAVRQQLHDVVPLPGALQKLAVPAPVEVYVDSAPLPAPLTAETVDLVLADLRTRAAGRRIVSLVACSGKSARRERPSIASAAISGSDVVVLTSGDPGHEHPASIVMGMLSGVPRVDPERVKTIVHRETAIAAAIRQAMPDGVVVLLGANAAGDRQVATELLHEVGTAAPA